MANAVYDDQDTNLDELEKAFHAPSAETSGSDIARQREVDSPNNKFNHSPDEAAKTKKPPKSDDAETLKDKEETPDDTVGEGYTGGGKKSGSAASRIRSRFLRSPKTISIFGTGALVLGAGTFFAFMSAPLLQIVHYANILQNPIKISENASNQRLGHFLWAQRSVGKGGAGQNVVARTRVDAVEYKMVKTVNARMAKVGLTYQFNDLGRVSGITIDMSKHPDYKSLSDNAARAKLAETLGVSPDKIEMPKRGGVLMKVDISKLPIKSQRSFFKGQIKTLGEGRVVTALNVRIMGKYLKMPNGWLHPWEKAKARGTQTVGNAVLDSKSYKKFKEWEKQRLKAKMALSERAKANLESIRGKLNTKATVTAGSVMGAQTAICLVREAANQIPETNREVTVIPAIASAADAIAMGSQGQSGDDFDDAMLSATFENWTDEKGKTPFHAEEVNKLQGKTGGTPADEGIIKSFSPDNSAASLIKILDDAVQAETLCSKEAMILSGLVGVTLIALGPGGWAAKAAMGVAGAAAGAAATTIVLKSVNYLFADKVVERVAHQGAEGGNLDALGAIEMANINARASGGVRLNSTQTATLQQEVFDNELHDFQQKSFVARVFNPRENRSVSGQIVDRTPLNQTQQVASVTHTISNAPKMALTNLAFLVTSRKVGAATPVTPTVPYYGVPAGTLDKDELSDPYELGDHVADLLDSSKGGDLIEHASVCWGNKIYKEGDTWDVKKDRDVNPASAEFQEGHCDDWSADVQAVSTWIGYVHDADGYLCANATKEDTGDSCDRVGVGTVASSATEQTPATFNQDDLLKDSSSMNCPAGTEDLGANGVQEGWTGGNMVKIRVCGIPGMKNTGGSHVPGDNGNVVVNVRIAANWLALFNKAKADGITLAAVSGFRTYAQQEALCPCDGVSVAKPGTSNHQMGLAIDVAGTSIMGSSSSSCSLRAVDPNSKIWTWLNNNAAAQGIKQYTKESWHWDPDPTKSGNRCGGDGSMRA
jgi:LAS superfamily LD-carboxypeptidase LdcB